MKFNIDLERLRLAKGKHCSCKLKKTDENICPCDKFINTGECICGIFKVEK